MAKSGQQGLTINQALAQFRRRAETVDPATLIDTFVTVGGLDVTLANRDHRIIFGRRGTGKTHALNFVAQKAKTIGELAVYIDLRRIGSNSYIYNNDAISIGTRATNLLRDFINAVSDAILGAATEPGAKFKLKRFQEKFDPLLESVRSVVVDGEAAETTRREEARSSDRDAGIGAGASLSGVGLRADLRRKGLQAESKGTERSKSGRERLSINIGNVSRRLEDVLASFGVPAWILIDEWASVPDALQPILADFLGRALLPIPDLTVQIGAIEQRCKLRGRFGDDDLGLELGADIFGDVILDDYFVYENDPRRAKQFFGELIYRHYRAVEGVDIKTVPRTFNEFRGQAFTQQRAFDELVRAAEGVPRDAINIVQLAAQRAGDESSSVPNIRAAAQDWYSRDKSSYLDTNLVAAELLQWIIDEVIGNRSARAFLLRASINDPVIEGLFDERILHVAKKNYSTRDEPGIRYRVMKLDYGCFIDLANTKLEPKAFLALDLEYKDGEIEVPEDDYRAIRRAVLNLEEFYKSRGVEVEA